MKRLFLSFFLTLFIPLSSQTLLTSSDVQKVMDQFFELHVDKKKMNSEIVERSLKIYVNNFDPTHAYLLQTEAKLYLQPNRTMLKKVLSEYQKNKFSTYFALDATIQKSIWRARGWRSEWEEDPASLVADAKELQKPSQESVKEFAEVEETLKNRHYQRLLQFVAFQMEELGYPSYDGKEKKLVTLCEKQIRLMENDYLGLGDENQELTDKEYQHHVILRTLKALAHSLDAHTAYFSPEEAYAMKVQLEKGMCGIGVVLREGIDGIVINELVNGGPAEKCGMLEVGDTIVEVDGQEIQHLSFQHALEIMRGKEGSKTVLGIMRFTSQNPEFMRVELTRSKITLDDKRVDVTSEPFGDGVIGKITLHSFYEGIDGLNSEQDLKNAIDQLRSEGPLYGLVLDMRENSGGFLSQAVKVSGLFISSGVVVISKYSDGSMKYYRVIDGSRYYDGPLVVLISRSSASATEIVAQTLKDYGVAVIVGDEQTHGKGTIQHQTITNDKSPSFFKITIGRYYTVSGKSPQIEGVKSDIYVPTRYSFEKMGEAYLDYPLPADEVASAFDDPLSDIDPFAKKWFQKYYVPTLQKPIEKWTSYIPTLRQNSQKRLLQNQNYQFFLKTIQRQLEPIEVVKAGSNDLQMEESVNIIKDMIFLSN